MSSAVNQFSQQLGQYLLEFPGYYPSGQTLGVVKSQKPNQEWVEFELTPFEADPQPVTAKAYFTSVSTLSELVNSYRKARDDHFFEDDIEAAMVHVSYYASDFIERIFNQASTYVSDEEAQQIAQWVSNLDVYTAVKSIESLLNSKADLSLLKIAKLYQWDVIFDHLAIRCGSRRYKDAERVVDMLIQHHGYRPCQLSKEAFYQFSDGWNAYPLYKILQNGQVLRLFVDQSDEDDVRQIIQHWNHVYGYTAHHLAMRASSYNEGQRVAIDLDALMTALQANGVEVLTPTGEYTQGLLKQVFTRPELNKSIPPDIKLELTNKAMTLESVIENGKLLEMVSRRELPPELADEYFALYGIQYSAMDPLHSAPIYQYFLPAQAAHVIRSSVETG